jgi:hypothetical protein
MMVERAKISRKRSLTSIYYTAKHTSPASEKKQIVRIVSSLPSRLVVEKENVSLTNPQQFLISFLASQGTKAQVKRFDTVENLFEEPKKFEIEAYGFEILDAVRTRNIDKLREFHSQGRPLKCSNQFGESILHLACRKGFEDVVDFLVNTANVPVWVKDDFGRSPLHDACWTVKPNFELMDLLLAKCPDLLLVSDARGHTPLAYVRREHWKKWVDYLSLKTTNLKPVKLVG